MLRTLALLLLATAACHLPTVAAEAELLTAESFKQQVSSAPGAAFIKFFAPWCGHCKRLAPTWEELADAVNGNPATIARVDCTQESALCNAHNVRGYPTLILFKGGEEQERYRGSRTLKAMTAFVQKHADMALPGGYKADTPATDDVKALALSMKEEAQVSAGVEWAEFEAVTFKKQVVAGTNYMIKVAVGGDDHVHVKVFVPLPHTGAPAELKSVEVGKSAEDAL